MDNIKPSTWLLMGGGIVLLLSTFLDWVSVGPFGANAWDTEFFGLLGIYCAIIGLIIGGGIALRQFGNVNMPDQIMGFTHEQIHLIGAEFALLITIGLLVRGDVGIGLWLGLLGSAAMMAGAVMDLKGTGTETAAPSQF